MLSPAAATNGVTPYGSNANTPKKRAKGPVSDAVPPTTQKSSASKRSAKSHRSSADVSMVPLSASPTSSGKHKRRLVDIEKSFSLSSEEKQVDSPLRKKAKVLSESEDDESSDDLLLIPSRPIPKRLSVNPLFKK